MTRSWLRQSLAVHTILRLVVASVLLGLAVALEFRAPGPGSVNPYFVLLGITYAASLGLMALLRVVDERPSSRRAPPSSAAAVSGWRR